MKAVLVALASLMVSGAAYATPTFNFGAAPNPLGTSHTYTTGPLQVTASGYNTSNALTMLYAKNAGGDEVGLGLANDPSGDHEIASGMGYVQLDVSKLFGLASGASFFTGSTTGSEAWQVFGSNTAGSLGTFLFGGNNEAFYLLPSFGHYSFYDFRAVPVGEHAARANFLLGGLTVAAVPEPATWAMMILGFGVIGAAARSRRGKRTVVHA